ncbi:DUF5723 family protein [uncultured Draconibacterium sp.]|uniref:DUF5723 family protein n=1 Tax=uncultured Draconibacterium sp. TaxID=1573823 RepID=UPI0025EBD7A2|nr:DUF5723 family protein [uncultured Draconibacterium sp.]
MRKFLSFLFLMYALTLSAQNTMYFMECLPQNNAFNPAYIPKLNMHIGLPGISGINVQAYNSGFNYSELDGFLDDLDNENYNPDEFINSIDGKNRFLSEARVNLLSFGFRLKDKGYFTFDLKANNILVNTAQPEVVYLLADYDNIPSENFPIIIDEMEMLENNFISMGFTYSRVINENLSIGLRPVINFNNIGFKTSGISCQVSREEYTERYDIGDGSGEMYENSYVEYNETFAGQVELGLPTEVNPEAVDGNELDLDEGLLPDDWIDDITLGNMLKNASFSIDLGATYQLDKWLFSASLLNLGTSKWRNNSYQLNGVFNDDDETINIEETDKIQVGIPPQIYLGAIRQFSSKWNYALLLNNTFYSTGSNASATLSLNGHVGSALSTSVSYTAGYKFNNLGLGLRLRFLPGTDLYFVTDNIIQVFNYKNAQRITAAFGINIAVGTKPDKLSEETI